MTATPESVGVAASATPTGVRPRLRGSGPARNRRSIAILLAPFLVFYCFVYAAPILYSLYESLFRERSSGLGFGGGAREFAGLANYTEVLNNDAFWAGMGRVALFGIVQVPVMLGIATGLALLLDSMAARGVPFFRISYFLPFAFPGVVAAILWAYLYSPTLSPIVSGMSALGVEADFLGPGTVLWSMANITTWSWTGYTMLIVLSALQAVPRDFYEAARIDGASEWAIAFRIKLPHVRSALVLSGTLSIIGTIQLFTEPNVLKIVSTNVGSEYTPMMLALQTAFQANNFHAAAALSVVIALIAGIVSFAYYRITTNLS